MLDRRILTTRSPQSLTTLARSRFAGAICALVASCLLCSGFLYSQTQQDPGVNAGQAGAGSGDSTNRTGSSTSKPGRSGDSGTAGKADPATQIPRAPQDKLAFEALVRDLDRAHRGPAEVAPAGSSPSEQNPSGREPADREPSGREPSGTEPSENRPALNRFRGELSILPIGRNVERIEVRLQAMFLAPRLLRYEVTEQGRRLERGLDKLGPWARTDKKPYSLKGRDYSQDRKSLAQHVRLAKLLLDFLDPASVLRGLENRSTVTSKPLAIGRAKALGPFRHVQGTLAKFPFYRAEGSSERARLEAWIGDDGLLQAVRATPIDEQGNPLRNADGVALSAEMVTFADFRDRDGVQIPTQLTIFEVGEAPSRPSQGAKIEIATLDLSPELAEASFTRPQ